MSDVDAFSFKPVERKELEDRARKLQTHLLRYEPYQMVVNLYSYAMSKFTANRNDYKFPYVEYASLILWLQVPPTKFESLTEEAVEVAYREIDKIFFDAHRLYGQSSAAAGAEDIEELAIRAKHSGLMIRNPAFEQHHRVILDGLFPPFSAELQSSLAFSVEDVIACFASFERVLAKCSRAFKADFEKAVADDDASVDFSQAFAGYFVLDAARVAAPASISESAAQAILDVFSVKFGEPEEHVLLPSPFSILREKPLLDLGGNRYIIPNLSLLVPAIQIRIESLLNPAVTDGANAGLWTRYERHRGEWVEATCYGLIERMMPHGRGTIGAYYLNSLGKQVEADVVYEVDDLLLLVEAKAGAFTPATFRGAPGSLKNDIRDVIQKGHDQTRRTLDYVLGGNLAFNDEHGAASFSLGAMPREVVRIVVTLAPTDIFAVSAAVLQRAGFITGDPTWIVPLTDLMILADCLSLPGELRYYARQRYAAMLDERLLVFDETDFLGIYLSKNDMLLFLDEEVDSILPDFGVADKLNRYYIAKDVKRPPRQPMANRLAQVIESLGRRHDPRWTHAVCDIFRLSGEARNDMARNVAEFLRIKDGRPHDFSVGKLGAWMITIVSFDRLRAHEMRDAFMRNIVPRQADTARRLVIGFNPQTGEASAEYYCRVHDTFYRIPPELHWSSPIRKN